MSRNPYDELPDVASFELTSDDIADGETLAAAHVSGIFGAGNKDDPSLPDGAVQLRNDAGFAGYLGSAPPAGHGPHRYYTVVHAVDVAELEVPADAAPAILGFNLFSHSLGRAMIVPVYEAGE